MGRRTEFAYDDADRVTEMTAPSDRAYGFDYDRNGNRTARHDARTGTSTRLGYTAGDRLERLHAGRQHAEPDATPTTSTTS